MDWFPKGKKLESENIYHRYLKFPFDITKHPVCDTQPEGMYHQELNPWICKNLNNFLGELGLFINDVVAYYTPPNGFLPIHVDGKKIDNRSKINITWGPKGGTTRWWSHNKSKNMANVGEIFKGKKEILDNIKNKHFWFPAKEDCELLYEASTNKVSLVNVGQFHSTYNPHPTKGRWTLCFVPISHKLKYDLGRSHLTFKESLEAFSPYIKESR